MKGTINAAESSAVELVSSDYVVQVVDKMIGYPAFLSQEDDDEYFAINGRIDVNHDRDGSITTNEEQAATGKESLFKCRMNFQSFSATIIKILSGGKSSLKLKKK